MATLGTAYVQILPTTTGITENLTSALTGASATAGQKSGGSFASSMAKGLAGGATVLAGAAASLVTGIVSSANAVASAGDTIDKTSQKLGVSASEFQTLQYAAEHAGFSVSAFQTAARSLAGTDFEGNVYDAVEAIQAIEDPAERAAAAEELLGTRAAQEMAALINGEQTLTEYKTSLEDLGGMMSDEMVADSAAFADAITDMNTAFSGLKTGLLGQFLPSITGVMNGVAALASGNEEGLALIQDGITSFLNNLLADLPAMVSIASGLISTLASTFITMLPQIIEVGAQLLIELANGIAANLPALIPVLTEVTLTIITALIQAIPSLIAAAGELLKGLLNGIIAAVPTVVAGLPAVGKSIIDGFISALATVAEIGTYIVEGIWQGMSNGMSWIYGKISGWVDSVLQWIKDLLGIASPSRVMADEVGQWMAKGIGLGFEDSIGDVNKDIADSIQTDYDITASTASAVGTGKVVQIIFNAKEITQADIDMIISKTNLALGGAI